MGTDVLGKERMRGLPEAPFRLMAEEAPSAIVVTDGPAHRIVYANRAFSRLSGQAPADLAGKSVADALSGIDLAVLEQARRTGETVRLAGHRLTLPDGEATWWDISSTPIGEDTEGRMILTTAQEVTGHLMACRNAEGARATLDALMTHIPEGITIARGPGVHVERVSAHGVELARKTEAELIGDYARDRPEAWEIFLPGSAVPMPPDDRPIARAIRTGETMSNRTLMMRRPDGSMLPVLCSCGPITDPEGHITGAVLAWRDITDLHLAEAAARGSQERLALALLAGGLGTWEIDLKTRRTQLDPRAAHMLGLAPEAAVVDARRVVSFIHPDDRPRVRAAFTAAARSRTPYAVEFRACIGLSEERWLSSQGTFAAGTAIGVARDITERRRREAALQNAVNARDLLVREADHRIKNSLQITANLLQLQQGRLPDPDARAALGDAIARVRAVGEAHRSLYQSRDLTTVDFGQTLADLCAHVSNLSAVVDVTCAGEGDLEVDAERALPLALIVNELLTNASKHAYPAGAAGTVRARASGMADALVVRISDDGVGLADADEADGPGLGGSIVRAMARQIGSSVEVASAPGRGTTVTLRLPRHSGGPESAAPLLRARHSPAGSSARS